MMPSRPQIRSDRHTKKSRGRPSIPFLRETILRHAGALFARRDFARVSIDEVAARSGVGKGSVYRQFGSKEELYAAVVIEGFRHLQDEIRNAMGARASTREQIEVVVRHTLVYFWTRRQFFALLRDPTALPRILERSYLKQRSELAKMIEAILIDGIGRGELRAGFDTRIVAESLLGMLRGINRYCREYTTPEHAADAVIALFFDGCAVPRTSS
ncbi:MAG TPA: TetR/AcrR family transcriptional regulator [Candidatus Binataceae bacterium]|nr:TetR/AcrR family transcriptional regulator [Candidatus Binataceae bacterium]